MRAVTWTAHLRSTVVMITVVVVANACMAQTAWDIPALTTAIVDLGKYVAMEFVRTIVPPPIMVPLSEYP